MTMQLLTQNWALVAASVLGLAILMFVLFRLFEDSPQGRLNTYVATLDGHKSEVVKAEKVLAKATERLAALRSKAEAIKPILLSEAEEAVQDATSLRKIAMDQVLRAQKKVREVILEEFPPNRHDGLRSKYL